MRVKNYMSDAPMSINGDTVYLKAFEIMKDKNLHHLPVVDDGGAVVGILTRRDLQLAAQHFKDAPVEVSEVMHTPVVTVSPEDSLREGARLMMENRIGGLPVMDGEARLAGVLTETDLLRALTDLLEPS